VEVPLSLFTSRDGVLTSTLTATGNGAALEIPLE